MSDGCGANVFCDQEDGRSPDGVSDHGICGAGMFDAVIEAIGMSAGDMSEAWGEKLFCIQACGMSAGVKPWAAPRPAGSAATAIMIPSCTAPRENASWAARSICEWTRIGRGYEVRRPASRPAAPAGAAEGRQPVTKSARFGLRVHAQ